MSDVPAIELRGVTKAFRGVPVLRGVDLSIERGETFTILGGSGSGKSVCLKHVIGLIRPDSGQVLVDGRDVTTCSEEELIEVRTHVGRRQRVEHHLHLALLEECGKLQQRLGDLRALVLPDQGDLLERAHGPGN